jgi:hypothetical protein
MEAFRGHWKNKIGKDRLKLDWDATWRTWCRNANSFGYPMVAATPAAVKKTERFDARGKLLE